MKVLKGEFLKLAFKEFNEYEKLHKPNWGTSDQPELSKNFKKYFWDKFPYLIPGKIPEPIVEIEIIEDEELIEKQPSIFDRASRFANYNWTEIQDKYNRGRTIISLIKEYEGLNYNSFIWACKRGLFKYEISAGKYHLAIKALETVYKSQRTRSEKKQSILEAIELLKKHQ